MKCIVCEAPQQLRVVDVPVPAAGEGEALLRVRRVGICGTDLHAYDGQQPYFSYPRVLGHELAAEVVELGQGPTANLRAGDQVTLLPYHACGTCGACRRDRPNCCVNMQVMGVHTDGGLREYCTAPLRQLLRVDGLSLDQTALIECFSIGAHAVRRAQVQKGEKALVIGAGPIGIGIMQMACLAGARVIAMDVNPARLAWCQEQLGIEPVIDASTDPAKAIADATDGEGPTIIFEATGNAASMNAGFGYLAHGGRYVLVSLVKGDITFSDPEFHKRETTLLSSRNATREDFLQVMAAMKARKLETDAFITHRIAFGDLTGVYESWTRPESGVIKALVEL